MAASAKRTAHAFCIGGDTAAMHARPVATALARRDARGDEVADLVALLVDYAAPTAGGAGVIAGVAERVALACLGDDHLWQDLQLASRAELSALMAHWFPRLAAKNRHDMKWKKFLYRQLCEREGLVACRAPSCGVCSDRAACFGSEDGASTGVSARP